MKTLTSMLLVFSLAQVALGQVSVDVVKSNVFTGVTSPRIVNDFILFQQENSAPKLSPAALIKVLTDYKFIKVKARQSLFESGPISKISDTEYLLVGSGKYAVEVTVFDPEKGIDEKIVPIDLGPDTPAPGPDIPTPIPPGPNPIPDDEFNNLARRVYDLSKNLQKRKEAATVYEDAVKTLTEKPSSTINSVVIELSSKLNAVIGSDTSLWKPLVDKVNEDLKSRWPMSRMEYTRYLSLIALGLKS